MSDIVERLMHQREYWPPEDQGLFVEAGAEIERLRTALRKIAFDEYTPEDEAREYPIPTMIWVGVAREALGEK